jgi:hypothetical protein
MATKHTPIDETQLPADELEPSTEFAQLVKRVGDRADLGAFGLGAIKQLVQERAAPRPAPAEEGTSSDTSDAA